MCCLDPLLMENSASLIIGVLTRVFNALIVDLIIICYNFDSTKSEDGEVIPFPLMQVFASIKIDLIPTFLNHFLLKTN